MYIDWGSFFFFRIWCSLFRTIYWKACSFLTELPLKLCQNSVGHICLAYFWIFFVFHWGVSPYFYPFFWTVLLKKTLESPLDCKEIQPANPKGNLSWIFIGRTDAEAEAPMLWPPDTKNRLIWKDPDAEKDWRQKEKGMTEDEVVGWWTWVWASSKSWWWTGKPGVLQSMGSQRVGQDWATELILLPHY